MFPAHTLNLNSSGSTRWASANSPRSNITTFTTFNQTNQSINQPHVDIDEEDETEEHYRYHHTINDEPSDEEPFNQSNEQFAGQISSHSVPHHARQSNEQLGSTTHSNAGLGQTYQSINQSVNQLNIQPRPKSRTMPSRGGGQTGRQNFSFAGRLRAFHAQQRIDGLYCILTLKDAPKLPPESPVDTSYEQDSAQSSSDSDSSSCSSDSSSSASSSASSSSDMSDSSRTPAKPTSSMSSKKSRSAARRAKRKARDEAEKKRKQRLAIVNAPRLFVVSKHGGLFGKQPEAAGATKPQPSPSSESMPSAQTRQKRPYVLHDAYVSKRHFQIWAERGRFFISDCQSLNGTFVRRQTVGEDGRLIGETETRSQIDVNSCLLSLGYGYQHTLHHPNPAGYRLVSGRAFVLGQCELLISECVDEESTSRQDISQKPVPYPVTVVSPPSSSSQSHYLIVQFSSSSSHSSPSTRSERVRIGPDTATVGSAPNCTIVLPDSELAPIHAFISYVNGRFFLREYDPSHSVGVWARLSSKPDESHPSLLCAGDIIRAGISELVVDIRAIPSAGGGGYGAGPSAASTHVPLNIHIPSDAPPSQPQFPRFDIGSCLEGNFIHQKEMQDRIVTVERFADFDQCLFVGVFDGHQERTVADFAAASLHHNLLLELAQSLPQSSPDFVNSRTLNSNPYHSVNSSDTQSHGHSPLTQEPVSTAIDLINCMRQAYRVTSLQITGMGEAAQYGGSTAVTALLWGERAITDHVPPQQSVQEPIVRMVVGNIGDSHCYLLRGQKLHELSYPHTARDPGEQARVRAAGGKITMNARLAGCLEVTRAFGDLGLVSSGLSNEPTVREVVLDLEHDTHILVCSDGIDVLSHDEIVSIIQNCEAEDKSMADTSRAIIDEAMRKKSRDNLSVVLVAVRRNTAAISSGTSEASASGNQSTSATSRSHQLHVLLPSPDSQTSQDVHSARDEQLSIQTSSLAVFQRSDEPQTAPPPDSHEEEFVDELPTSRALDQSQSSPFSK